MAGEAYTVLWDGRRNGPCGAQLFVLEETPVQPPALRQAGRAEYARAAVYAALQGGDKSMTELAEACDVTMELVNGALWMLLKKGLVQKCSERPRRNGGSVWGRRLETVYGIR